MIKKILLLYILILLSACTSNEYTAKNVEKPEPGTAPSNLFINGRYILQPEIFDILETQSPGAGNEIQLTDGMLNLAKDQPFYGYVFEGETFDCGSKAGFIQANLAFAMEDDEIATQLRKDFAKYTK